MHLETWLEKDLVNAVLTGSAMCGCVGKRPLLHIHAIVNIRYYLRLVQINDRIE